MVEEFGGVWHGADKIVTKHLLAAPASRSTAWRNKRVWQEMHAAPRQFESGKFLADLTERVIANLQSGIDTGDRSESKQNWREELRENRDPSNKSEEVRLERALASTSESRRSGWSNQVPVASGLMGQRRDRRRCIDLLRRNGTACDFVELKVKSNNPAFALVEVLLYGVVYLAQRWNAELRSDGSKNCAIFDAASVGLRVLAPRTYFHGFELGWLERELTNGLEEVTNKNGPKMRLSSHWSPGFETWDSKILGDAMGLRSMLDFSRWKDAFPIGTPGEI